MPNEFPFKVTYQDLTDLVDGLKALRDTKYLNGDVEYYVKYSWAISEGEGRLVERARIADTINRLFGVKLEEETRYIEALTEGKRQVAALKALEEEEAARETEEV